MKTAALAALAFLGGLVGGWCLAMLGYILATTAFGYFDREGSAAMGIAFAGGPFLGLILGTAAAFFVVLRRNRRQRPARR